MNFSPEVRPIPERTFDDITEEGKKRAEFLAEKLKNEKKGLK